MPPDILARAPALLAVALLSSAGPGSSPAQAASSGSQNAACRTTWAAPLADWTPERRDRFQSRCQPWLRRLERSLIEKDEACMGKLDQGPACAKASRDLVALNAKQDALSDWLRTGHPPAS